MNDKNDFTKDKIKLESYIREAEIAISTWNTMPNEHRRKLANIKFWIKFKKQMNNYLQQL